MRKVTMSDALGDGKKSRKKMIDTKPCAVPYDPMTFHTRYDLSDMHVRSANFPQGVCEDDFRDSVWTDVMPHRLWGKALMAVKPEGAVFATWMQTASDEDILAFAKGFYVEGGAGEPPVELTGCRFVVFSQQSGYHTYRLDVVGVLPENKAKVAEYRSPLWERHLTYEYVDGMRIERDEFLIDPRRRY